MRWLCECDVTNRPERAECWSCGRPRPPTPADLADALLARSAEAHAATLERDAWRRRAEDAERAERENERMVRIVHERIGEVLGALNINAPGEDAVENWGEVVRVMARMRGDLTAARALLREVDEVWSRCVARDFPAVEDAEVRALGERIGFGALMDAAEKEWRASLAARYPLCVGGEFVHGPCRATVDSLRARIEALLGGER